MNTKVLVSLSLLVGIGAALHSVMPGIFFGMKPDLMLTMMFLGILLFPEKKNVVLLGIVTGIISGITTTFPMGMVPNMIDKPITAFLFFGMFLLASKFKVNAVTASALTALGTIISGAVFLTSALLLAGLPGGAGFAGLFAAVVLPAAVVNTVTMFIIYPIVQNILRRSNVLSQA